MQSEIASGQVLLATTLAQKCFPCPSAGVCGILGMEIDLELWVGEPRELGSHAGLSNTAGVLGSSGSTVSVPKG